MLKQYPKQYENFYTREKIKKRCVLENVGTDIGLDHQEYLKLMKEKYGIFESTIFNLLVQNVWLTRRFCYKGVRRKKFFSNGFAMDFAFGIFLRKFVGFENKIFSTRQYFPIVSFFDDFFPNFDIYNPFKEPEQYKYPYKNVKLCYLTMVYQMEERLELLQYAEDNNLGYTDFVDYVINYAFCHNDDIGREKFRFKMSYYWMPYIKNLDLKENVHLLDTMLKNKKL